MTELYIDGVSAVLPKDFSVQVKRENPLLTKNGEYTYDITLSLHCPANANLYKHLNRLNSVDEVSTKRSAILIADNRVYCNGTEIITGWTNESVSIQIASGNSELNYFIGAEMLISELDMKQTIVPDGVADKQRHIEKNYPDVEYCLAPVFNRTDEKMYNDWHFQGSYAVPEPVEDSVFVPQPYLCPFLKEMLRALGYTLTVNQLENTVFKDVYLCHAWKTDKWNEMCPEWTVLDFLTQIERLFDVVFIIDYKTKSAALLFRGKYLAGTKTAHIRLVDDVYEAEVEDEPDVEDMAECNVSYNLQGDDYWKFACLAEDVKQTALHDAIPADFQPSDERVGYLIAWFSIESNQRTDTIFTDERTGRDYIFVSAEQSPHFLMVDAFANLVRENSVVDVELDITPATPYAAAVLVRPGDGYMEPINRSVHLPSVNEGTDSESEEPKTLVDMIREGDAGSSSKSGLALSFYSGLTSIYVYNRQDCMFPVPYIDEYGMIGNDDTVEGYYKTNSTGASLRLNALDNLIYQSVYDIDYKHGIKISSYDPNVFDLTTVFEIRNKRYVCKEIEYTLDADGRKGAWTGTFYPIRISDTEADARWILTDGKWRDGGVWLDNGRWLDS